MSRSSGAARAKRRVGIREVAEHAGVAVSSVSRVLTGRPDVSDAMRTRVMLAVAELGYEPDWLAQSMRRRETKTVGFTMSDISNTVMVQIVLGAEAVLRESGYSMLFTNSEGDRERDAEHIGTLGRGRVDGFVIALAAEGHAPTIAALRAAHVPAVVIDRHMPRSVGASAAYFDHRQGMREAVGHLLDLGHRRISLVLGQPFRPTTERRRGLVDAYTTRDLPVTYDVIEGDYSERHGMQAAERALAAKHPPTAIVAGSNQLLIGVLRHLKRRGVKVGRHISVASCDEVSLTELHDPPIAVVHRDNRQIGCESATLLLRRLNGDEEPATVTLPTSFEARASCAPPHRPG